MAKRRMRIRILGLMIAVVALGLGAAWFVAANKVVANAQRLVNAANSLQHADGSVLKISYDRLERTGFPAVGVRFVNPVIDFSTPGVAVAEPESVKPAGPVVAQRIGTVHVVMKRKGTVDVVTDYITHAFRAHSRGDGDMQLQVGDKQVHILSSNENVSMSLSAKDYAAFDRWNHLDFSSSAAVLAAAKDIGALKLAMGRIAAKDADSGAILFTQEKTEISLTNETVPGKIIFDLSVLLKGTEITPEYNKIVSELVALVGMSNPMANADNVPFAADRAGKQDFDMAVQVHVPDSPSQVDAAGYVHMQRLTYKNNFYTIQLPFDVVLSEKAGVRKASIQFNGSAEINPAIAGEMERVVEMGLPFILPGAAVEMNAALKKQVLAALPTASELGPITLKLDVEATTDGGAAEEANPTAKLDTHENLILRSFAFNHKRWGLESNGKASRDSKGAVLEMTLVCKQCANMTQDGYNRAQAVQAVLTLLEPARTAWPLSPALVANLDQQLAELGTKNAATGDIVFTVTTPQPNDIRINGKTLD